MKNGKKNIIHFSNEDKSKMDFKGYDFGKGLFYRTNFSDSNLEGVNFRGANLKYCLLVSKKQRI
ncbi:MAG: hypothetical protein VR72_12780 [Clostridiaceae bacterium BRH_c20a]|nr:MAG: hypothetical protein VR72_12780 [Clostridiaceae bacterium BRH_c20a]